MFSTPILVQIEVDKSTGLRYASCEDIGVHIFAKQNEPSIEAFIYSCILERNDLFEEGKIKKLLKLEAKDE